MGLNLHACVTCMAVKTVQFVVQAQLAIGVEMILILVVQLPLVTQYGTVSIMGHLHTYCQILPSAEAADRN